MIIYQKDKNHQNNQAEKEEWNLKFNLKMELKIISNKNLRSIHTKCINILILIRRSKNLFFKFLFEKEYQKVKKMSEKQLQEFTDEVHSTEFKELGSKDMVQAILTLVDDRETKKLVVEHMLKQGKITLNF